MNRRNFLHQCCSALLVGAAVPLVAPTTQEFMGASWEITIKDDSVPPTTKSYKFADPVFIGRSYMLLDCGMIIRDSDKTGSRTTLVCAGEVIEP